MTAESEGEQIKNDDSFVLLFFLFIALLFYEVNIFVIVWMCGGATTPKTIGVRYT
jgi:hypothetical protein